MAARLTEQYPLRSRVDILLGAAWIPGQVVRHDHPAVWVQVANGRLWFVTNSRRIRPAKKEDDNE